jgi:hypothetical protein
MTDVTEGTDEPSDTDEPAVADEAGPDDNAAPADDPFGIFGPEQAEDVYVASADVSLAGMLMLGANKWQRIDGMGLARRALEEPPTGDVRRDLSQEERTLLANARAWCMLVHGDLGHRSRRDDPFVLADAERNVEEARSAAPRSPQVETSLALLRLRQGRTAEALESARRAVDAYASFSEHERTGRSQGGAILALVTLAVATAASGDTATARALGAAARAVKLPVDLDEVAFDALMAQLDEATSASA